MDSGSPTNVEGEARFEVIVTNVQDDVGRLS